MTKCREFFVLSLFVALLGLLGHVSTSASSLKYIAGTKSQDDKALQTITSKNINQIKIVKTLAGGNVNDVAWSSNGDRFAIARISGVWLYLPSAFQDQYLNSSEANLIPTGNVPANTLAFHPDGNILAIGLGNLIDRSTGGGFILWDLEQHAVVASYPLDNNVVTDIKFAANGKHLVAATYPVGLYLVDLHTEIVQLVSEEVLAFDTSQSGNLLAITEISDSHRVSLVELSTEDITRTQSTSLDASVTSLAFHPTNTEQLYVGTESGIFSWDTLVDSAELFLDKPANVIELSQSGEYIAFVGETLGIWDFSTDVLKEFTEISGEYLTFNNNDQSLFITGVNGYIHSVKLREYDVVEWLSPVSFPQLRLISFHFAEKNRIVLSWTGAETHVYLWEVLSGHESALVIPGYHPEITFNRDGTLMALIIGTSVHVDDLLSEDKLTVLESLENVFDVEFSACSETLQSIGSPDAVHIWDVLSEEISKTLKFSLHEYQILEMCESENLIILSTTEQLILIDTHTQSSSIVELPEHINWVEVNSDRSRAIVVRDLWQVIDIIDIASGDTITSIETEFTIDTVSLGPGNELLVVGGSNGELTFWNLATELLIHQVGLFPAEIVSIEGISFNTDGTMLAVASSDGTVKILGVE